MNALREKMKRGGRLYGTHVQLSDHRICEMLGQTGFDFLWIDTEHTSTDYGALESHLIAARAGGIASLVRVPWNDPILAKRVLDMGPDGIVFPMVNTPEEARRAMDACLYPPRGRRSFGPVRAMRYGEEPLTRYLADAADDVVRLTQVESKTAVECLREIAAVDGVDGFMLGPMDLSGSIGHLGELDGETDALIERAIETAHACGKPIGVSTGADTAEGLARWIAKDLDMLSAGSDIGGILHGARRTLGILREKSDG